MTASHDDEKLADLISRFGHAGYGVWWLVVEIVASVLEAGREPEVTYHVSKWSHLLSVRGSHVLSTLVKLEVTHLVTVVRHGDDITVRIPNLLKYRDEYNRKSGQTPESVRSKNRTDTHTDTHTEEKGQKHVATATSEPDEFQLSATPSSAVRSDVPAGPTFEEWWAVWWNHDGKKDARKVWDQIVKKRGGQFLIDQAIAYRQRFEATDKWEFKSRMLPATWLRGDRWNDQAPFRSQSNGSAPYRKDDYVA